jgi:beta-glucanase (GH16 family)
MKKIIGIAIVVLMVLVASCNAKKEVVAANKKSFVDPETPKSTQPFIVSDSTTKNFDKSKWKLVFSDEFNDTKIDTSKWTVENAPKKRVDIMLYSNNDQVQEKDGRAYIYYSKSSLNDTTYMAGRFNSNKKFATTYGYLEAKMHLVKPNGYQTAFWMMPEGKGMASTTTPDGTANDGAEIDIVEGNKLRSYSLGLHWDGYAKPAHKGTGGNIKMKDLYDVEYRIFALEWTPTYLKFYCDGKVVKEITDPKAIPHVDEYLYFSGSCFGKNDWLQGDVRVNEFIQNGGVEKAYIDYVRVYKSDEKSQKK